MSLRTTSVKNYFLGTVLSTTYENRKHSMNVRSLYFDSPVVFGQIFTRYVFEDISLTTFLGNERFENKIDVNSKTIRGWREIFVDAEPFSDDELED